MGTVFPPQVRMRMKSVVAPDLSVIIATAFPSLSRPMNQGGWIARGALRLSQEVRA